MFTGIVKITAPVARFEKRGSGAVLSLENPWKETDPARLPKPGESISVNGACLTVVSANRALISFDISGETLEKTNLSNVSPGRLVNLERALRLGQDISGHFVTGHVDATGRVERLEKFDRFAELSVSVPQELLVYVVAKGSIAVEGVSLTVASVEGNVFTVALIPETLRRTALESLSPGDAVNVETDLLGKYVIRYLSLWKEPGGPGGLTLERLADAGF